MRRRRRQCERGFFRRLIRAVVRLGCRIDAHVGSALISRVTRDPDEESRAQIRDLCVMGSILVFVLALHVVAHWNLYFTHLASGR